MIALKLIAIKFSKKLTIICYTYILGVGINYFIFNLKNMDAQKKKTVIGVKKSITLLKKNLEKIEKNEYCIDIIQQNLAAVGLLKSVNLQLLESHLNCCVRRAIKSKNEKLLNEMMQELLMVMKTAQNK